MRTFLSNCKGTVTTVKRMSDLVGLTPHPRAGQRQPGTTGSSRRLQTPGGLGRVHRSDGRRRPASLISHSNLHTAGCFSNILKCFDRLKRFKALFSQKF